MQIMSQTCYLCWKRRQNCELRQTVRDIYNSGYECGAAESRNSRSSLREKKKEVEDKPGIKERMAYREMAREYRARKRARWKLRTKGRGRKRGRAPVWRSKCVWEASNFFLYPSDSIRAVAFPLSILIFIAHGVNTLPGIARRNFLVIRDRKQSFAHGNDSCVGIVIVQLNYI